MSKPRRRWLQFSLRTLLIVMVFAAGYFAGLGAMLRRVQRQTEKAIRAEQVAREAERLARMEAERARF